VRVVGCVGKCLYLLLCIFVDNFKNRGFVFSICFLSDVAIDSSVLVNMVSC
jgi:hypothetical protein